MQPMMKLPEVKECCVNLVILRIFPKQALISVAMQKLMQGACGLGPMQAELASSMTSGLILK